MFDSFTEAAEENARSRVYLGVHYQFDADDGIATGTALANQLTGNVLTYTQTCPDWNCIQPIPTPSERIDGGDEHSLAVQPDGTVVASGVNGNGQLGDGTTTDRLSPVPVSGLSDIIAVAAGGGHSLALDSGGQVWAWGDNSSGQLGDGTTTNRLTPVQVSGLSDVVAVAAGAAHSLALRADGTAWAWGNNGSGRLGDGTTTNRLTPVQVSGLSDVVAVAAGGGHSLAVSTGAVSAWGENIFGQLGDNGQSGSSSSVPVTVAVGGDGTSIAAGNRHSLLLLSDGTLLGWGQNARGQLGNGSGTNSPIPVQVDDTNLTEAAAIGAGLDHGLSLDSRSRAWAWGANDGQLGNGTSTLSAVPVPFG
ncbi:RCC1 repeat- and reductase domain-containing protein [Jiangella aurantiaca]|uniref:RCC1 repeat-and reductase domain-containing protein n=1 Tax=Jiangella aurantiaca TaxID=2530373 RepID=A0A4R5AJV8_9ACTN|nr:RCC1 repeat- and reductase domain-containing protein [Jiangella aurantiaca]